MTFHNSGDELHKSLRITGGVMKHHAFILWSLLIFSFHVLASSGHYPGLQQASWEILSTILVVKPRSRLQVPIKSKPGRLVHHPARRQNP